MNYTVTFKPEAIEQLGESWFTAGRSRAVTDAAASAERELKRDPVDDQTRRVEGLFVRAFPPLVFTFEKSDDDRIIVVVGVGLLR